MVHTHSSGCMMGEIDNEYGETVLPVDYVDIRWLSALVDLLFVF